MSQLKIDHIAVIAASLDEGAAYIQEKLGVDVPMGGEHLAMGTHNRLMTLGNDAYFEIIAVAPNLEAPDRPRWFGLDNPPAEPRIGTWIARTDDLYTLASESTVQVGAITPMSRGDLEWEITIRNDGSLPLSGLFPTLIEWPEGEPPVNAISDLGCQLKRLRLHTPNPNETRTHLQSIGADNLVQIIPSDGEPHLSAQIKTPKGLVTLT